MSLFSPWNLTSRVHDLNSFPSDGVKCFVKRDDELSCGISGTKIRKYSSLIPYWLNHRITHLVIIAGPQSNNLLSVLQIAREYSLTVTVFLIKPWKLEVKGNYKLSLMFLNPDEIHWVPRDEWHGVFERAKAYINKLKKPAFLLEEGASVPESLAGAMSLADDIVHNEYTLGLTFNHVFIDAGTGFAAAALIHRMQQLQHRAQIYVLLLADDESVFSHKLQKWTGSLPKNYQCIYPATARSFGAINQVIKSEVRRMAIEEGLLVDPIYSAKLFYEARAYIDKNHLKGNALIIHSGGALTLSGFDW